MDIIPFLHENSVEALGKTIQAAENPAEIIQALAPSDYFQLIKTMDEGLGMMLLEAGSPDQWQYVLDLELWNRDRLDLPKVSRWLHRLALAAPQQLVQWLIVEGEGLVQYYLSRLIEVAVIEDPQEAQDLPEGFFSLDGQFYLRIKDVNNRDEGLVDFLRTLAVEDYEKYQSLLLEMDTVIPAEEEEELYRLRNVRMAEYGFLPYEEALVVYAPLDPSLLRSARTPDRSLDRDGKKFSGMVPLLPLAQPRTRNLFLEVAAGVQDPFLLGRLRLEFAGLANQILSADRVNTFDVEVLIRACDRAARLVNLAVEKVCGLDEAAVEDLLEQNSLVTLFRVGIGLVRKLSWEAERWRKLSWFHRQGLGALFWGEPRGKVLAGLLQKRPAYYAGTREREPYRDFEKLSELREGLETLQGLMVLDGLLEKMAASYPFPEALLQRAETTFYTPLFNFWARLRLKLEPTLAGISLEQAKRFLAELQDPSSQPPGIPDRFQPIFIRTIMDRTDKVDPQAAALLEQTLGLIWLDFREEYGQVSPENLDSRFSKFLTIEPPA